ncbi:MAG: AraC family transcriptional regulator, partial [Bacteroidota bacterium]
MPELEANVLSCWRRANERVTLFPQFNIHSTPLLVLVLQGLIFACLLLYRYRKEGVVADVLIACFLLIMIYHRTTYTIGFMGWYDTFKNTKINYFLISLGLATGPLIYLYVRTTLQAPFRLTRQDTWHFLPLVIWIVYRLVILGHDAMQADWAVGYEGDWQRHFHLVYVSPFMRMFTYSSQLLYLAFTWQLFAQYQTKIKRFFSNTYQMELNWLKIFLLVFSFLFVYDALTDIVDSFITELHYTHKWWVHFFSAIALVYLGTKAYVTDLTQLHQLNFAIEAPT